MKISTRLIPKGALKLFRKTLMLLACLLAVCLILPAAAENPVDDGPEIMKIDVSFTDTTLQAGDPVFGHFAVTGQDARPYQNCRSWWEYVREYAAPQGVSITGKAVFQEETWGDGPTYENISGDSSLNSDVDTALIQMLYFFAEAADTNGQTLTESAMYSFPNERAEAPFAVTGYPDPETSAPMEVGDAISVSYQIDTEFTAASYDWVYSDSEEDALLHTPLTAAEGQGWNIIGQNSSMEPSGLMFVIPEEGIDEVYLMFSVRDGRGGAKNLESPVIRISDRGVYLNIKENEAAIGDYIHIVYDIVGDFEDHPFYCGIFATYDGREDYYHIGGGDPLSDTRGEFVYKVTKGDFLQVNLFNGGVDMDEEVGDWLESASDCIRITGYDREKMTFTAAVEEETITVGQPIHVTYAYTGPEEMKEMQISIAESTEETVVHHTIYTVSAWEGVLEYLPLGDGDFLGVHGNALDDQDGWFMLYERGCDGLALQPGTVEKLILPAQTQEIGEEAFVGVAARYVQIPAGCESIGARAFADSSVLTVWIPDTVQEIAEDAFDGDACPRLIVRSDTPAAEYARSHPGVAFTELYE